MTDTIARVENDAAPLATGSVAAADVAHDVARRNRIALALLLAAVFVVFLNETMMGVALPRIQESLHIDATRGQWLTTAFALTMAVVIPTTGWLMQRFTTADALVRIWRSAWAWMPVDRAKGLFRLAWVVTSLVGLAGLIVAALAALLA